VRVCPRCGLKYPIDQESCFIDGSALEPYADDRLGQTVGGRYVLESVLGTGAMAVVYRARHRLVERPCAVKILNADIAGVEVVRERFRREAKAAQKVAHPNVVEIFDQGETEAGELYLVMELLDGETLAERIRHGPLGVDRTLPLAVQMARALARGHHLDVVHRDLKPENVFLARTEADSPRVVLLDFGISRSLHDERLTSAGEIFGTPPYMAPERITSIDAGAPGDLYAMGVVLYEMITGELPFTAESPAEYFVLHLQQTPPRLRDSCPTVPAALDDLVAALLAKDPDSRPVDARSVLQTLIAISRALGVDVPPETSVPVESSDRAPTLPPADVDAWSRRLAVLERMLAVAFADGPPESSRRQLETLRGRVRDLEGLRARSMDQQRVLEQLEARDREGRQRFGHAADALGADVSHAREEARGIAAVVSAARARAEEARSAALRAHEDVIHWEGRSGFSVPYRELAEAYRAMAARVDDWATATDEVRAREAGAAERRLVVADLEFQAEEIRQALARFQQGLEAEAAACNEQIRSLGAEADATERDLLALAASFAKGLRGRADLRELFRELERGEG
jgi:serine/threonine protein kinase